MKEKTRESKRKIMPKETLGGCSVAEREEKGGKVKFNCFDKAVIMK